MAAKSVWCWFFVTTASVVAVNGSNAKLPWYDPNFAFTARVSMLVGNMTVDELISQMIHETPAIARLGLPAYSYWTEAAHGIAGSGRATVFPASIGRAAAFDVDLEKAAGRITALEGAAKHNDYMAAHNNSSTDGNAITYFAPVINIVRTPTWGRIQETYGESVTLSGRLGSAYVQGIQASSGPVLPYNNTYQLGSAMAKHFLAYDIESAIINGSFEGQYRLQFDASVTQADLYQTYSPVFKALVDANISTLMCSYNAVNKVPMCASPLMQSLLRGEFGYDGIISSDGGAVTYSHTEHHYTPDVPTAAAASLNAGVDLNTGGNNNDGTGWWFGYQTLNQSLSRGLIQVAQLQTAVSRLLLLRMRLGMFDPADVVPYRRLTAATTVDSPSHRRVAREYATKSMVLLKNHNSTLPLNGDVRSIAIVGPNANSTSVLLSNYAGCRLPFDGPIPVDCRLVTAVAGMQANAPVNVSVAFEPGCHLNTSDAKVAAAAVQLAAQSDITIAIMGLSTTNDEGRAVFEAEAHDRLELELSAAQSELLEQLCAVASNRLVLVLLNGGPVSLTAEQVKCADAIVEAFYPGEEGGNALADVLYGVVSPSGRLPYTMYQAGAVLAPRLSMRMAEPPGQTFRYYTGEPAYGFGFGLSYTSFEYTGLHLSSTSISSSGSVTVKVDVTNVGLTFVADEVVQLYATYVNETTAQKCQSFPLYELKAFRKLVAMLPLETRTVTVVIAASELALVGKDCKMAVQAGQYQLHVGGRSPSLGVYQPEQPLLLASFHVE